MRIAAYKELTWSDCISEPRCWDLGRISNKTHLTKALDFENVFKVLKWLCPAPSPWPYEHPKDTIGIGMSPVYPIDPAASSNSTRVHSPLTRIAAHRLVQALALTRMPSNESAPPQLQRPQGDCRAICEGIRRIHLEICEATRTHHRASFSKPFARFVLVCG